MTKRVAARIASFTVAALAVLTVFAVHGGQAARAYRQELEYTYERALSELGEELRTMETALQKAEYAVDGPWLERLALELSTSSGAAKAAIEALPFADNRMERVTRFLSQVGDYAMALSGKAGMGETITDEETDSLVTMGEYAGMLREAFAQVQENLARQGLHIGDAQAALANLSAAAELPRFDDGLDELAESFNGYPELLYDGPFSDHLNQKEPAYTQGKADVSEDEARQTAAQRMGYAPQYLTADGTTENTLPTYNFSCVDKAVRVARAGGEVVSFARYTQPADTLLYTQEALESARDYLTQLGFDSMEESYYVVGGNTCTVNYAYRLPADLEGFDGIVCYPDLIKVTVSMETGEVIGFNATGYFMNHTDRTPQAPALSVQEAQAKLSGRLTVTGTKLAVIPSPGEFELFCYEFACQSVQGEELLVYIDAQTGATRQMYRLLKSDGGVLAE